MRNKTWPKNGKEKDIIFLKKDTRFGDKDKLPNKLGVMLQMVGDIIKLEQDLCSFVILNASKVMFFFFMLQVTKEQAKTPHKLTNGEAPKTLKP